MPESNGGGRLDRIEKILADMIEHRNAEFRQLMTWQVLTQDQIRAMGEKVDKLADSHEAERQRLDALWANTDKRVADLVGAIGRLIDRLPPPPNG
jgi:predicted  nucleic acid-binding Zn-ribbon protein